MSIFIDVAIDVLSKAQQPMSAKAIWSTADAEGIISDKLAGKTPIQTLKSKLSVDIRKNGTSSLFVRTAPGRFFLRQRVQTGQQLYDAGPNVPSGSSEKVLVFPQQVLDSLGRFQGIKKNSSQLYKQILESNQCYYKPRIEAENDNTVKQIVTYVLICTPDRVLSFKRGNYTLADKQLRGSHCIGFGGHVNENDSDLFNQKDFGVRSSAIRELFEELAIPLSERSKIPSSNGVQLIGALNDDSTDVGKRHFAFVFKYTPENINAWMPPQKGEKAVTDLHWIDLKSTQLSIVQFEYWSQLCFRAYFYSALQLQPTYLIRKKSKSQKHVLCLVGQIGSGKSETTKVFNKEYGYKVINSGRVMAKLLGISPIPKTPRAAFQKKAADFFNSNSDAPKILAEAIIQGISKKNALIDGIRNSSTLNKVAELLATKNMSMSLIYIHMPFDLSYELYRARENKNIDIDGFLKILHSKSEREVTSLIKKADVIIYNWIGRSSYHATIKKMMKEFLY